MRPSFFVSSTSFFSHIIYAGNSALLIYSKGIVEMSKIICNSCEHFGVCMRYSMGKKYNKDASKCPEYLESLLPHQLKLNKLKAEIAAERSKVTKLSCGAESSEEKYEISYEQHAAVLKSLHRNGLAIVDGKLCWRNPETQSWEIADSNMIKKRYGVVFGPHFRVRTDADAEADAKYHKQVIDEYIQRKRYNQSKANGEPFVFVHIRRVALELGRPLVDIPPAILFRLSLLACHLARNDTLLMCACRGGLKAMTRKDIKRCLGLPRTTFLRFWDAVYAPEEKEDRYIIGNDEDGYHLILNSERVAKTVMENGEKKFVPQQMPLYRYGQLERGRSVRVQKLNINAMQALYNNGMVECEDGSERRIRPTDHAALGRLMLLTPYLHEEENVLCSNPYEKRVDMIQPLTSPEIAKIIGLDPAHISRELKAMQRFVIDIETDDIFQVTNEKGEVRLRSKRLCKRMYLFRCRKVQGKEFLFLNPAWIYFGAAERYEELLLSDCLSPKTDTSSPAMDIQVPNEM